MVLLSVVVCALYSVTLANALELNVNDQGTMNNTWDPEISLISFVSFNQERRAGHLGGLVEFYNGSRQGSPERANGARPSDGESRDFAGASLFGPLVGYWRYTGDDQFNRLVTELLAESMGINPPLDNDAQGLWALGAMSAAESEFPLKPRNGTPSYIRYAQGVFDIQAARWDMGTCNGGLAWKFPGEGESSGYNYKSSFANGILFQLAARLARFTEKQTYTDWANKAWDWSRSVELVTPEYRIFDGIIGASGCKETNHIQWTHNAGLFLYGSALMFNQTNGDPQWRNRTQALLSSTNDTFFTGNGHKPKVISGAPSNVMVEVTCEYVSGSITCNLDQFGFKGLAAQWMGPTIRAAPFLATQISSGLESSATAAAQQCSADTNGTICGFRWVDDEVGRFFGFGTQLSALNIIIANLVSSSKPPVTAKTSALQGNLTPRTIPRSLRYIVRGDHDLDCYMCF